MVAPILRRALLYVPASSAKFLEKSKRLTVDCVAYDLEDSVTPSKKEAARNTLREFLSQDRAPGIREQAVRINSVKSGLAHADLTAVLAATHVDTIVVPKVQSASDLHFVTDIIRHHYQQKQQQQQPQHQPQQQPQPRILALIESARALMDLRAICTASPLLSGLIFAAEDFALDLSLTRTASLTEFLYARSAVVTACAAHQLPSAIDLVCTAYGPGAESERVLRTECEGGSALGFNGKQLIHPAQIGVCQEAFAPSAERVDWAVRVVLADAKAVERGRGAWTLDGKMIDAPVVGLAKGIVARAEACGIDVAAKGQQWKDQEPE